MEWNMDHLWAIFGVGFWFGVVFWFFLHLIGAPIQDLAGAWHHATPERIFASGLMIALGYFVITIGVAIFFGGFLVAERAVIAWLMILYFSAAIVAFMKWWLK